MRVAHNPHVYYRDHSNVTSPLVPQNLTHNPVKEFGMKFYNILLTLEYSSQFVAPNY
jgi:hypothetical protein